MRKHARWWPTVVTALLLPLLLSLSYWQWQRAGAKQQLLERFTASQQHAPQPLLALHDLADAAQRYQPVTVQGRWLHQYSAWLINQPQHGVLGAHLYTPLQLQDGRWLLINRGWHAWHMGQALPTVPTLDTELSTLHGRLAQPINPALRLGAGDADWPRLTYIDYLALQQRWNTTLLPVVVLLDADSASGYQRDWQPQFGSMTPERHRGYAVQWLALALTLVLLYGYSRFRPQD